MESQHQVSDAKLAEIVDVVSKAAGQRHPCWRSAFRGMDRNRNGMVSSREARYFFEGYGYGHATADQFFKRLGPDASGEIELREFAKHFAEHVDQPGCLLKRDPDVQRRQQETPAFEKLSKGPDKEERKPEVSEEALRRAALRRSVSEPPRPERKYIPSISKAAQDLRADDSKPLEELPAAGLKASSIGLQHKDKMKKIVKETRRYQGRADESTASKAQDDMPQQRQKRDVKDLGGQVFQGDGPGSIDFKRFQEHFNQFFTKKRPMDVPQATSRSGDSTFETTYQFSYAPSSRGSSTAR